MQMRIGDVVTIEQAASQREHRAVLLCPVSYDRSGVPVSGTVHAFGTKDSDAYRLARELNERAAQEGHGSTPYGSASGARQLSWSNLTASKEPRSPEFRYPALVVQRYANPRYLKRIEAANSWHHQTESVRDAWNQPSPPPARDAWNQHSPASARDAWNQPSTPPARDAEAQRFPENSTGAEGAINKAEKSQKRTKKLLWIIPAMPVAIFIIMFILELMERYNMINLTEGQAENIIEFFGYPLLVLIFVGPLAWIISLIRHLVVKSRLKKLRGLGNPTAANVSYHAPYAAPSPAQATWNQQHPAPAPATGVQQYHLPTQAAGRPPSPPPYTALGAESRTVYAFRVYADSFEIFLAPNTPGNSGQPESRVISYDSIMSVNLKSDRIVAQRYYYGSKGRTAGRYWFCEFKSAVWRVITKEGEIELNEDVFLKQDVQILFDMFRRKNVFLSENDPGAIRTMSLKWWTAQTFPFLLFALIALPILLALPLVYIPIFLPFLLFGIVSDVRSLKRSDEVQTYLKDPNIKKKWP